MRGYFTGGFPKGDCSMEAIHTTRGWKVSIAQVVHCKCCSRVVDTRAELVVLVFGSQICRLTEHTNVERTDVRDGEVSLLG